MYYSFIMLKPDALQEASRGGHHAVFQTQEGIEIERLGYKR